MQVAEVGILIGSTLLWAAVGSFVFTDGLPLNRPRKAIAIGLLSVWLTIILCLAAFARDPDGRYAASPLKPWFNSLKSGKGPCCDLSDGYRVDDADWETHDGKYRVRIDGEWVDVDDDALLTQPNLAGKTMVWPMFNDGHPKVRCFIPGSMT